MQDLAEFFDDTFPLPISGKVYVVPSPPARLGLQFVATAEIARRRRAGLEVSEAELASLELDDDEERQWQARVLGSAFAEMVADDVPWTWLKHAANTAYAWHIAGRAAAERVWAAPAGDRPGEAEAPPA